MPVSQKDLANQMVAQLRVLDPSISAEVGTPERKILDTFAQSLYDSQIDLAALDSGLNLDNKFGIQLDRFLSLFGFFRQKAVAASGFVSFSRVTPSTQDIRIPAGSTVQSPSNTNDIEIIDIQFTTTYDVILPAGDTSIIAPVLCSTTGSHGNVAANRVTQIVGETIWGITGVMNHTAMSGGADKESDEEFKLRFKNTIFRNLAGTRDQFMALAIATAYTSKANVIGPISTYREYVQVPPVDDATSYDVDGSNPDSAISGNGSAGEYTSALSTIPYAKDIWESNPVFVSNGVQGLQSVFYRQDTDFVFNWASSGAANKGDTYRFYNATPNKLDTRTPGSVAVAGVTAEPPNVTFKNVYTGANTAVTSIRPGDVVLLEHQYLSAASRNSKTANITNAVDVFIDGGNGTLSSVVFPRPSTTTAFVDNVASKYHYENYRRVGDPQKRPIIGNILTPLFWQPVMDLPDSIIVGDNTYLKNVHYWTIEDVSGISGSVRSRGGIEWAHDIKGKDIADNTTDPSQFTGVLIWDSTGDPVGGQPIEVDNYTYDKNIVDLQTSLNGAKQVTTDVLARKSKQRYFKLDLTIMYSPGASVIDTNASISAAVDTFLKSLYFGSAVQLSDLLQVVHNVSGVDNVRWTSDSPAASIATSAQTDFVRMVETDINGKPLLNVTVERTKPGTASSQEVQSLFLVGQPTGGTFTLTYNNYTTAPLAYNASASTIQAAIAALTGSPLITVTEDTRSTTGVLMPIRSFKIAFTTGIGNGVPANGSHPAISGASLLTGGPFAITSDFFLRDDELAKLATSIYTSPSGFVDSAAGIIARPRAQNTWVRTG